MTFWPEHSVTQNLLAEAKCGDRAAVNRLLERHRTSLRKLIQLRLDKRLSQRVDASDIVQDVLFEANTRLRDYLSDPRLPFHLWLRQLAQDRMIDMPQFADQSGFDLMGQLADHELTPAAASIRKEMEVRFLGALEQMDEENREILVMRHFEQLGNSEIAAALGLSAAATGMRHLRALRKLRAILGDRPSQTGSNHE